MNQTFNKNFKFIYVGIFVIFAVIALVLPTLVYLDNQKITIINEKDYNYLDDPSFVCKIENYIQTEKAISLEGWFAKKGKSISWRNCYIVLKNLNDGTCLQLETKAVKENNAKDFFDDGINYDYAGFSTTLQINKLNNNTYLVLLLFEDNGQMFLFNTEQAITVGQITK